MHHVAILHDVFLAFLTELACCSAAGLAIQLTVVSEARRLGLDKTALEIGMDDTRGLRRLRANGNGPRTRFRLTAREEALQAQKAISLAHETRQTRFLKTQVGKKHLRVFRIKLCQLGLHLGANGHRTHAIDLGELRRHLVLVDIRDIEHRLHRQQVQVVNGLHLLIGKAKAGSAMALVQARFHLLRRLPLQRERLVAAGILFQATHRLLQRAQVGENQLGLDGLDVAFGIDATIDMHNVGIAEIADDLANRVGFANVSEELVAQALTLACAGDQTGDVDEFHRRGHDAGGVVDLLETQQARVGNRHDAHIRLDGGEGVIRGKPALVGKRGEQG